ncbi:MAG: tetraacyldisaccharide 4'-kinase [Rickettsiales bacterium]|jgi:tetraacyldisaccharide 4'-kinase|nr:tetraacyldisaccharide 4'-kinase [Rickettsiales bacterium]
MKTPKFWSSKNFLSLTLYPLSLIYYFFYKVRIAINRRPYRSKIPVICVGNLIAGGSGKTPVCIEIAKFLKAKNKTFCFLSKGYNGKFSGVVEAAGKKAEAVGDEPLILSNYGPTFVAKSRVNGLKYINNNFDYDYIIIDDGMQNPTFVKNKIILVIDGIFGFGNGFILPAGALRDKIKNVYKTIDFVVIINATSKVIKILEEYKIKFTTAKIVASNNIDKDAEYIAFCGLGNPEKFKKTLVEEDVKLKKFLAFGDHYCYSEKNMKELYGFGYRLITTEKDWVRLNDRDRAAISFLAISLVLDKNLLEDIL